MFQAKKTDFQAGISKISLYVRWRKNLDFKAFGYRMDEDKINLPYWNARLGITIIKRWQYVPGRDFWQGTLVSPYDSRRVG